jgi:hypothetical protein
MTEANPRNRYPFSENLMSSLTRVICGVMLAAFGVLFVSGAAQAQPRRHYHHHHHHHHHYRHR